MDLAVVLVMESKTGEERQTARLRSTLLLLGALMPLLALLNYPCSIEIFCF